MIYLYNCTYKKVQRTNIPLQDKSTANSTLKFFLLLNIDGELMETNCHDFSKIKLRLSLERNKEARAEPGGVTSGTSSPHPPLKKYGLVSFLFSEFCLFKRVVYTAFVTTSHSPNFCYKTVSPFLKILDPPLEAQNFQFFYGTVTGN